MNLLKETIEELNTNGYKPSDISFIGSEDGVYSCTWEQFKSLADEDYDNGYGAQEVAKDLIIVYNDGVVSTREEYDGSEWWKTRMKSKHKGNTKKIHGVFTKSVGWDNLATIQDFYDES